MKKCRGLLLLLICLLAFCVTALADMLQDDIKALGEADSFDAQLALLDKMAVENADSFEEADPNDRLTVRAAPGIPEGLIPEDWENMTYTDAKSLPEAMRGRKFIGLYCPGGLPLIAGDLFVRLPDAMRAKSLEEAEYALIVRHHSEPSGYQYNMPANSYHRDYEAYAVELKTGKATRFWTHRNQAKRSGFSNQLNGHVFNQDEIWNHLCESFFGELRHTQADGTVLLFSLTGKTCFLKGYEGNLTALDVPARVQGHLVSGIVEKCFSNKQDLLTVRLSEGIVNIPDEAFADCYNLKSVVLPDTIKTIGNRAFKNCYRLDNIALPHLLESIGYEAFARNTQLQQIVLPDSLTFLGGEAFTGCEKLSRVVISAGLIALKDTTFGSYANIMCCYVPDSVTRGLSDQSPSMTDSRMVIYAPEGSYAHQFALKKGYAYVACDSPDDMPDVAFITQDDLEFRLFSGESQLYAYEGKDASVTVPETVGGVPVTSVRHGALTLGDRPPHRIILPNSLRQVQRLAFEARGEGTRHLYVPNPKTAFEVGAVSTDKPARLIIHAPEGSLAQQYMTEREYKGVSFEAWDGVSYPGAPEGADAVVVADALALAKQVQNEVRTFWQGCDQKEYAWLQRIPGYDINEPKAAGVLYITQPQLDALASKMGGMDSVATGVATGMATLFNQPSNLPYTMASQQTAQTRQLSPISDGYSAIVALVWQTDTVLVVIENRGMGQGAFICSTEELIQTLSPDTILKMAADHGVAGNECAVYKGDELTALLKSDEDRSQR